ncbi:MAG: site-2 protease family protein [Minisyncoccia bacterium]
MSIVIFVVILLVLVLVHEFGHFFTAKKFGIRVDEFGFGFPPKLFGFKKGETEYTFNLLPLGGFVKIFGESPDEESVSGPDAKRSFINKPKWQQAIVLFAGVFMNFMLAWFLFSVGFISGLPTSVGSAPAGYDLENVNLVITSIAKESPAEKAGLKVGDKIIEISMPYSANPEDYLRNPNPEELKNFITSHTQANEEYPLWIEYIRGKGQKMDYADEIGGEFAQVVPTREEGKDLIIGISMDQVGTAKLPVHRAFYEGLKLTLSVTKGTVVGLFSLLGQAIQGEGSMAAVTGPVGMVGIVGDAYEFGFVYLLSFAALISINLAIINLFPFPALDGGRLFFLLIEKIKGSHINPKIANTANMIGFIILITLMLVITYHDVAKLF